MYVIFNTFSHTLESMCMLILVCVKKCLISFLEVEILIIEQREWKDLFKCQMKSGAYSDTPFLVVTAALLQIDYIYCYLASNGLCSIGSNRNRTTTTKRRQCWRNSKIGQQGLAPPMKIIISYLKIMINIMKSKIIIILQYNNALVKSYRY